MILTILNKVLKRGIEELNSIYFASDFLVGFLI